MSSTIRNIMLLVGVIAVAGVIYYTFFSGDEEEALTNDGISGKEQVQLETETLLARIQDLSQIKIDQSLFSDPRFMSLTNWRVELPEESSGRTNPFAPIE